MQSALNTLVSHVVSHGIKNVVIAPGSRNAPLILAFSRHPQLSCFSIIDERSAAYTALGLARESGTPTVIICTSGTAVLNLYPAICEAYYAQIPLLIITADRPPEWIDQWDGQAIHQNEIFHQHILGSYTYNPLQPDFSVFEAIRLCSFPVLGPVHINVPLAEPLYAHANLPFEYPNIETVPTTVNTEFAFDLHLNNHKKILVFCGHDAFSNQHDSFLESLKQHPGIVFIADVISGCCDFQTISNWDALLTMADEIQKEALQPDVLVTFGKFTVSKSLKQFLRAFKPQIHYHITDNHTIADPFLTHPIEVNGTVAQFVNSLNSDLGSTDYKLLWQQVSGKTEVALNALLNADEFDEFSVLHTILDKLPDTSIIHLGNSMPVRIASYLNGLYKCKNLYANRGTSGIDGSVSTAAGQSMATSELTVLICGDISFLYDVNGLWNQYLKGNFKVVIINNSGGGIFRLIDGPNNLPEREQYFATRSERSAKDLAAAFNCDYVRVSENTDFRNAIDGWLKITERPAILEIFTNNESTTKFFNRLKSSKLVNPF